MIPVAHPRVVTGLASGALVVRPPAYCWRGAARGSGTGEIAAPSPAPPPTDDAPVASEALDVAHVEGAAAREVDAPKAATVIQMPSREAA